MTWQLITIGTALIGLFLAINMWRTGYLKGVEWITRFYINGEDMTELVNEYIQEGIPPKVKAKLEQLRTQAQGRTSVKDETMAEIAKIQGANNGNAKEREQQPD